MTGDPQTHFSAAPLKTLGPVYRYYMHKMCITGHKVPIKGSTKMCLGIKGLGQRAKQGKGEKKCPTLVVFFFSLLGQQLESFLVASHFTSSSITSHKPKKLWSPIFSWKKIIWPIFCNMWLVTIVGQWMENLTTFKRGEKSHSIVCWVGKITSPLRWLCNDVSKWIWRSSICTFYFYVFHIFFL